MSSTVSAPCAFEVVFCGCTSYSDSLIVWLLSSSQLEMKQKSLLSLGNDSEEKRGLEAAEVNPESLGKCTSNSYHSWAIAFPF
jgi:hypothetical protein